MDIACCIRAKAPWPSLGTLQITCCIQCCKEYPNSYMGKSKDIVLMCYFFNSGSHAHTIRLFSKSLEVSDIKWTQAQVKVNDTCIYMYSIYCRITLFIITQFIFVHIMYIQVYFNSLPFYHIVYCFTIFYCLLLYWTVIVLL